MDGRLSGRVAFVTVGGTGDDDRTGALARALSAEGAMVVLVAADAEAGGRLAAAMPPGTAVFCSGDDLAGDLDALVELAEELARRP